jgi:hypothetical protein
MKMKDLPKALIIIGTIALALGTISSLASSLGFGFTLVIRALNYWRGAVALYLLAIALLQLKK